MIIKKFLSIFVVAIFGACNYSQDRSLEEGQVNSIATGTSNIFSETSINTNSHSDKPGTEDTIVTIKFHGLSVSINRLMVYDEEKNLTRIQKDTVNISVEMGETIEGQQLTIQTNNLTNIIVEQRYETSVVISDEGPHCDLIDWKHYTSNWVELKPRAGVYLAQTYSAEQRGKFPKISIDELKAAVKKHCGKEWFNLVRNTKSLNETPIDIGISRHFIRISGKQKDSGKPVTRLIIIDEPMGC